MTQTTIYTLMDPKTEEFVYFDSGDVKTDVIIRRSSKCESPAEAEVKRQSALKSLTKWTESMCKNPHTSSSNQVDYKNRKRRLTGYINKLVVVKIVTKVTTVV